MGALTGHRILENYAPHKHLFWIKYKIIKMLFPITPFEYGKIFYICTDYIA